MEILREMRVRTFEKNLAMESRDLIDNLEDKIGKTYKDLEKAMEDIKREVGSASLLEKMEDQVLRDKVFHKKGGLRRQLDGFLCIYGLGTLNGFSKTIIASIKRIRDSITHGDDDDEENPFLSRISLSTGFEDKKQGFFTYLIPPKNINLVNITNENIKKVESKPVDKKYQDGVLDIPLRETLTAFEGFIDFLTSLMTELYILVEEWSKLVYK